MRTIYIDENYICHSTNADGRKAIKTAELDNVCDNALECYKYIPATKGKDTLIQCIDSAKASQEELIAQLKAEIERLKSNND